MASKNNVYVGARYVPKFYEHNQGVWEFGVAYEALTIVLDGSGNSYTSKRPVPIGVLLTNEEYWVNTAIFNAQVRALSDALDDEVTRRQTDVNAVNTKLNRYTSMQKKNVFLIGDSYVVRDGTGDHHAIRTALQDVCNSVREISAGGYGVGRDGQKFIDLFNAHIGEYAESVRETVTDVCIIGGYNDYHTPETVNTANVHAFVQRVKEAFPYAVIKVMFVGHTTITANVQPLCQACRNWMRLFKIEGCECFNFSNVLNIAGAHTTDGIHPTNAGYDALIPVIKSALLGHVEYYSNCNPALTAGPYVSGAPQLAFLTNNSNFTSLRIGAFNPIINLPSGTKLQNYSIEIGEWDYDQCSINFGNAYDSRIHHESASVPAYISAVEDGHNNVYACSVTYSVYANKLYASLTFVHPGAMGYYTGDVHQLFLPRAVIHFDKNFFTY